LDKVSGVLEQVAAKSERTTEALRVGMNTSNQAVETTRRIAEMLEALAVRLNEEHATLADRLTKAASGLADAVEPFSVRLQGALGQVTTLAEDLESGSSSWDAASPYGDLGRTTQKTRSIASGKTACPLSLYKSRGQLFTSPGATISAHQVYRDITTKIAPRFPRLRSIGFDPALAPDVAQRRSANSDVQEVPQKFNYMTAPCYTLEGLLKARRVAHDGHPILRWNISNVAVKRDEASRLRP
jgi:hypothetical protein